MKVLVAVDRSPESHMALRYACHLLDHFDAEVEAVYVKPDVLAVELENFGVPFIKKTGPREKIEAEAKRVEEVIVNACHVCLGAQIPCEPRMLIGEPAEEIIREARDGGYDLVVLGSHGHSAISGLLLGAVHSQVLHHTSQPLLIVRELRDIQKVLVAYRGTSCDQEALRFVAPLLARRKPEMTILHVQETDMGESDEYARACLMQGDRTLQELGFQPVVKEAKGGFVEETLRETGMAPYDLIVLGAYSHGRSKLRIISNEAVRLVSRTTRPVLVFRGKE